MAAGPFFRIDPAILLDSRVYERDYSAGGWRLDNQDNIIIIINISSPPFLGRPRRPYIVFSFR